jgi:putative ABC transport system permease protein
MYKAEQKFGKIFTYFAILSILIASLGLLGLASYTAESSVKETGIRKVLGAKVLGLIISLLKKHLKLVLIANCLAIPVAYFAMNKWLGNYAYKTGISVWIFTLSFIISILVALLTASYQAVRVARSNPVDSLKYE